jgi:copper homeostasis protein
MAHGLVLEALCGSADDVIEAAAEGADRVELCSSLSAGGLTPSPGAVRVAALRGGIPIMAMLRPRPAGFCYSAGEFEAMMADAPALLEAGASGLVFGLLAESGRIDLARSARLMACAPRGEWVFHRAFDLVPEPFRALEELVDLGVRRVLTKGQANSFEEGEALLLELRERAAGRIEILVPGVRPANVDHIVRDDGFEQLHFGRSRERVDPSNGARPEVYFGLATRGREHLYEGFDAPYFAGLRDLARAGFAASEGRPGSAHRSKVHG